MVFIDVDTGVTRRISIKNYLITFRPDLDYSVSFRPIWWLLGLTEMEYNFFICIHRSSFCHQASSTPTVSVTSELLLAH